MGIAMNLHYFHRTEINRNPFTNYQIDLKLDTNNDLEMVPANLTIMTIEFPLVANFKNGGAVLFVFA